MENRVLTILDFCFIITNEGESTPLKEYLDEFGKRAEFCGLKPIKNTRDVYGLYYDKLAELESKGAKMGVCSSKLFNGIVKYESGYEELSISVIPPGSILDSIMYFDREGCLIYKRNLYGKK